MNAPSPCIPIEAVFYDGKITVVIVFVFTEQGIGDDVRKLNKTGHFGVKEQRHLGKIHNGIPPTISGFLKNLRPCLKLLRGR